MLHRQTKTPRYQLGCALPARSATPTTTPPPFGVCDCYRLGASDREHHGRSEALAAGQEHPNDVNVRRANTHVSALLRSVTSDEVAATDRSACAFRAQSPLLRLLRRAEDVRNAFERYGEIRDVYMPKDFHTGCVQNLHASRLWDTTGFGVMLHSHGLREAQHVR